MLIIFIMLKTVFHQIVALCRHNNNTRGEKDSKHGTAKQGTAGFLCEEILRNEEVFSGKKFISPKFSEPESTWEIDDLATC